MKLDEFKETKEYKIWETLALYVEEHGLRQTDIVSKKDIVDFWEPFLDLIFKLGNLFKQTGKLKELKVKWMRPIFYILEESKITLDGIVYEPPKESLDCGQELKRRLGLFCECIERFPRLEQSNFKAWKKEFQKLSGDLWKTIIRFVTKIGFRELHQTLKDILQPLLDLRRISNRLFRLECEDYGLTEFIMFKNPNDVKNYIPEVRLFKEREDIKQKRDLQMDALDEYIKNVTQEENYKYNFDKDHFKLERNNYIEKGIQSDDYIKMKFRRDTLQVELEKAFLNCFKYFNIKQSDLFPDIPDIRKLYMNNEIQNKTYLPIKFYNDEMNNYLTDLKIMMYEMKANGMSRIEIPIRENKNFTMLMKNIYNLHFKIDRLYGNILSIDQFEFFYKCLFTLIHSNIKEELSILKNKDFMEIALVKYIVLSAMRNSVNIEENMRRICKDKGEYFKRENYFQILNYQLDTDSDFIYNLDIRRHYLYGTEKRDELERIKNSIEQEIIQFKGRYWMLEGMFNPNERVDWINAIEILRNINNLVQDDIRDYILMYFKEKELNKIKEKEKDNNSKRHNSSKKNLNISSSSIKQMKVKKDEKSKKKKVYRQNSNQDKSFESEDEIILNKRANLKYDLLRPPFVWNFPVDEFKAKITKDLKEKEKNKEKEKQFEIKKEEEDIPFTEIRKVNPKDFYKDGRVVKFMDLLDKITISLINYSSKEKNDILKFLIENTLNVFGITYYQMYKKEEEEIQY